MADFHGMLPMFIIDSFSSKPFGGNPAAVCLLPTTQGLPEDVLQKIASEMNLSETAFIRKLKDEDDFKTCHRFGLRWLTPTVEVRLCGHATLAAAATLFYCIENQSQELEFETLSGTLKARKTNTGIQLDLPQDPPHSIQNLDEFAELLKLIAPSDHIVDVQYAPDDQFLVLRLKNGLTRSELECLPVNVDQFKASYKGNRLIGIIVTLLGSKDTGCVDDVGAGYDFVSRVFCPWSGIPEDPVTGAAHTILSCYWSKITGKQSLYGRQCSKRGGDIHMTLADGGRVVISGPATVVLKGHINV